MNIILGRCKYNWRIWFKAKRGCQKSRKVVYTSTSSVWQVSVIRLVTL